MADGGVQLRTVDRRRRPTNSVGKPYFVLGCRPAQVDARSSPVCCCGAQVENQSVSRDTLNQWRLGNRLIHHAAAPPVRIWIVDRKTLSYAAGSSQGSLLVVWPLQFANFLKVARSGWFIGNEPLALDD